MQAKQMAYHEDSIAVLSYCFHMKGKHRDIFWNKKYGEKHNHLMPMIDNPCDVRRLSSEPFDVFGKEYKGPLSPKGAYSWKYI